MKKAFTLVEIIFTVVIAGILIVGTSQMLNALSTSAQKAKELSNLSLDTQSTIDQISSLLYHRVPNSVIAYDGNSSIEPIISMTGSSNKILEWIGVLHEASINGAISNFIDMEASNYSTGILSTPESNFTKVNHILVNKFNTAYGYVDLRKAGLVFAGSFDAGVGEATNFGWHGTSNKNIRKMRQPYYGSKGPNIKLFGGRPTYIYEKYYLADTAYTVARGEDIDKNADCVTALDVANDELNNALILFYSYRPWLGETFCADKGTKGRKNGTATLLSLDIVGLKVQYQNFTIRLSIDANRSIRGMSKKGAASSVHVTKQKVVF